jgi:hypothetical protein
MPGEFHPFIGEERTEVVTKIREELAAQAAADAQLPHNQLNDLRSRLQEARQRHHCQTVCLCGHREFQQHEGQS